MNRPGDQVILRPVHILLLLLGFLFTVDAGLAVYAIQRHAQNDKNAHILDITTSGLGLTDLCVSTEARYTRHPAVSDPIVPFMDYPGAMEHFPTGSFWAPPPSAKMENIVNND